jgi:hypothetical protein
MTEEELTSKLIDAFKLGRTYEILESSEIYSNNERAKVVLAEYIELVQNTAKAFKESTKE